ncbi:Uncharacterised protein [Staphylococcus devriesei]|nr:Uncharacterised protein [Staphylococcus devriesei]
MFGKLKFNRKKEMHEKKLSKELSDKYIKDISIKYNFKFTLVTRVFS